MSPTPTPTPDLTFIETRVLFEAIAARYDGAALILVRKQGVKDPVDGPRLSDVVTLWKNITDEPAFLEYVAHIKRTQGSRPLREDDL